MERKKRKIKDDSKKFKKSKTGGETEALTLNKETKCVEILHSKVVLCTIYEPECVQHRVQLQMCIKCLFFLCVSQDVKEGMLMLGCVKEVTDFEVIVGLPCGLLGFLSIANISDSYTKMLNEQLESPDTEVKLLFSSFFSVHMCVYMIVLLKMWILFLPHRRSALW